MEASRTQEFTKSWMHMTVIILHIVRGILFLSAMFLVSPTILFIAVTSAELFVANWFRSRRIESWGVSAGLSFFHLLLPMTFNTIVLLIVTISCFLQLALLILIRLTGDFTFTRLTEMEHDTSIEPTALQMRTLQLVVIAQLIKAGFMFLGLLTIIEHPYYLEGISWLFDLPATAVLSMFLVFDLLSVVGLILGVELSFHLTVLLATVSLIETMLSLQPMVFLISVWIVLLLTMCLPKDAFYYRVLNRLKQTSDGGLTIKLPIEQEEI